MIYLKPNEPRLLPFVKKAEWRAPSLAQPKDCFGHENQTRFRIRGMLGDGYVRWIGWFEDRDDADAFLWAVVQGTLRQQPALWRLCLPHWHPDLSEGLTYDFATVSFLTTTTGSNQTLTSAADWNNSSNTIELIGAGGSGGLGSGIQHGTGGGGGEYGKTTNFSFATPGTTTAVYQLGTGGALVTGASGNGNAGGSTWFNGTTQAGASLGAIGGGAGQGGSGNRNGGSAATGGVGPTHNPGGRGGNLSGPSGNGGSGGGGAGGPNGAGNNGTDSNSTGSGISTPGGSADAGSGGGGGASAGGTGSDGAEWGTKGSGGGGGGNASANAGAGGNYGGGGGGSCLTSVNSGAGKQGIIVLTWTPKVYGFQLASFGI